MLLGNVSIATSVEYQNHQLILIIFTLIKRYYLLDAALRLSLPNLLAYLYTGSTVFQALIMKTSMEDCNK